MRNGDENADDIAGRFTGTYTGADARSCKYGTTCEITDKKGKGLPESGKGEALEIPHSPEKEPDSCLTDWHYTMDPTFNPVITDDSAAFSEQAVAAMEKELSKLQLTDSYQLLEKIVNYKDSPACKEKQQCSLVDGINTFSAKYQQEPGVSGPLKVGNSLVDAFTLQYYEGFPMDQVAWGEIKSDQQWRCCRS